MGLKGAPTCKLHATIAKSNHRIFGKKKEKKDNASVKCDCKDENSQLNLAKQHLTNKVLNDYFIFVKNIFSISSRI